MDLSEPLSTMPKAVSPSLSSFVAVHPSRSGAYESTEPTFTAYSVERYCYRCWAKCAGTHAASWSFLGSAHSVVKDNVVPYGIKFP